MFCLLSTQREFDAYNQQGGPIFEGSDGKFFRTICPRSSKNALQAKGFASTKAHEDTKAHKQELAKRILGEKIH